MEKIKRQNRSSSQSGIKTWCLHLCYYLDTTWMCLVANGNFRPAWSLCAANSYHGKSVTVEKPDKTTYGRYKSSPFFKI